MQPINWFDLTPPPLSVFPITLLSTFPNKIQAHNLLQSQPPLQSRKCNRPRLLPKRLKIIDVPVHLSCHFSVWTKHKGTLEPKLEILIYMQDQYLSATSNVNLSPTQSHNIKMVFKCDIWIGSQIRITAVGNGASFLSYRTNKSSKPLWKINKLILISLLVSLRSHF